MIFTFHEANTKRKEGYYDKERISQETFDYVSSSGLVLPLANVPVTSSLNQTKKAAGSEPAVMTFAEGEGTGEEFKEESWVMESNAAGEPHKGSLAIESYQPSSDTYGY